MSYSVSAALQAAIFTALDGVPDLAGRVFDAPPGGTLPDPYVLIGGEEVLDRSDALARGALHRALISVHSSAAGFQAAKDMAALVNDAVLALSGPLSRGRVIGARFHKAKATRTNSGQDRKIELRFDLRVEDEI
jgi:hypothetical protein